MCLSVELLEVFIAHFSQTIMKTTSALAWAFVTVHILFIGVELFDCSSLVSLILCFAFHIKTLTSCLLIETRRGRTSQKGSRATGE